MDLLDREITESNVFRLKYAKTLLTLSQVNLHPLVALKT